MFWLGSIKRCESQRYLFDNHFFFDYFLCQTLGIENDQHISLPSRNSESYFYVFYFPVFVSQTYFLYQYFNFFTGNTQHIHIVTFIVGFLESNGDCVNASVVVPLHSKSSRISYSQRQFIRKKKEVRRSQCIFSN